jgi:hypothetical protein
MEPKMSKSKFVLMRVNAAGYTGEPVSMLCSYDPASDILLVLKTIPYEAGERAGFLRITTQVADATHDAVFTEDETREAIVSFFALEAMNLINLADAVKRFDPKNKIERDGMDEGGMKYRIQPDINNGQFAVLIACHYAKKQRDVNTMATFLEEMELFEV